MNNKEKNKQVSDVLLGVGLLLIAILFIVGGIYALKGISDYSEVSANKERENSIKEIVKQSDIKTEHITVNDKHEGGFLFMFSDTDKISVTNANHNKSDLIIIGKNTDNIKDKFIKDRKKPYKVKVMDTGSNEKILYQYDDYKLDTDSKYFKTKIRKLHDL